MGAKNKPKTGGRKAGTPNRLTLDLIETLQEKGFDPAAELIRVNIEAWKEYNRASEIFDAIQDKRIAYDLVPLTESEASTYLKIAQDSAKDLMKYVYPQRKAVELSGQNGKDLFQSFNDLVMKVYNERKT